VKLLVFQTHKENKQKRRVISQFCFILPSKKENTKTVILSILIHMVSVTEVVGPCRRTTK